MAKGIKLPDIPEDEQTPVVKALVGIIEELAVKVQQQASPGLVAVRKKPNQVPRLRMNDC